MRVLVQQSLVGACLAQLCCDHGPMQLAPRTAYTIITTIAAFTGVPRTLHVRVERARAGLQQRQAIFWRLHLPCATPIDGALAAQELVP